MRLSFYKKIKANNILNARIFLPQPKNNAFIEKVTFFTQIYHEKDRVHIAEEVLHRKAFA